MSIRCGVKLQLRISKNSRVQSPCEGKSPFHMGDEKMQSKRNLKFQLSIAWLNLEVSKPKGDTDCLPLPRLEGIFNVDVPFLHNRRAQGLFHSPPSYGIRPRAKKTCVRGTASVCVWSSVRACRRIVRPASYKGHFTCPTTAGAAVATTPITLAHVDTF